MSSESYFVNEDLSLLQSAVFEQAKRDFSQESIARELVNTVSLSYISKTPQQSEFGSFLSLCYETAVEAYFTSLKKHCLACANRFFDRPELCEDLAQDCLKELLCSKQPIRNPKAWLARVVHNKASIAYKKRAKQKLVEQELKADLLNPPTDTETDRMIRTINSSDVRRLLSKSDYTVWKDIKSHKSLKAYAASKGISYQTAKERKHRLKTNLRSAYLKELGWNRSPLILSFAELSAIKRFVEKLIARYTNPASSEIQRRPEPKLDEALDGVDTVLEWSVSRRDTNTFNLVVVTMCGEELAPISVQVGLTRSNRIIVKESKRLQLIAVLDTKDNPVLKQAKGFVQLNRERLLALIPKAEVKDQTLFEDFVRNVKHRGDDPQSPEDLIFRLDD